MSNDTILTITWVNDDVRHLAKQMGIDEAKALEAVQDAISQVEERSIEAGWTAIETILEEIEEA